MRLIISFVFAALLTCRLCAEITIAASKADPYSDLDDAAINILTQCYKNRISATGFVGNSSDYLLKTVLSRKLIDVTLLGESRMVSNAVLGRASMIQQRLAIVVLTYEWHSSGIFYIDHFFYFVESIRQTIWWNQHASYIVILKVGPGCSMAYAFFAMFWEKSIINAKIICIENRVVPSKIQILTYNPYIDQAPKPWDHFMVYKCRRLGLSLTQKLHMYRREYQNDETVCNRLDFDRTQNLGGQIIFTDSQLLVRKHTEAEYRSSQYSRGLENTNVILLILKTMNARYLVIRAVNKTERIYQKTFVDLYQVSTPMQGSLSLSITHPVAFTGGIFMSRFRGHKTQLEKVLGVVDKASLVSTCIILVMTMIFLKLFVDQALVPAFLNVVRIICNVGFMNLRENTPTRIFISCVLFFVVTMQVIFQGDLASLLTTTVANRNINTMQDVVDLASKVYSDIVNTPLFPRMKNFKGRMIRIPDRMSCSAHLVNDSTAVCYGTPQTSIDQAIKDKLHLGDQEYGHFYLVKVMNKNWPLELRANKIIRRIFEADISKPPRVRAFQKSLKDFQDDDDVKANKDFTVMTLEHLHFAFVILGIGLACATVVFIGEIIIHRVCSMVRTTRVHYFK